VDHNDGVDYILEHAPKTDFKEWTYEEFHCAMQKLQRDGILEGLKQSVIIGRCTAQLKGSYADESEIGNHLSIMLDTIDYLEDKFVQDVYTWKALDAIKEWLPEMYPNDSERYKSLVNNLSTFLNDHGLNTDDMSVLLSDLENIKDCFNDNEYKCHNAIRRLRLKGSTHNLEQK